MFEIDVKDANRLARDLDHFAKKSVPHAARNALNDLAFTGRRVWAEEQRQTFTVRNTWTGRQNRVDKARGTNVRTMQATLGSLAEYMDEREFGETKQKKGKHGVPIPTLYARGGSKKRRVRKPHRLPQIRLSHSGSSKRGRQERAVAIKRAFSSGNKFVYLEQGNRKGIIKLLGSRRKPKYRTVWDLSRPTVRVEPVPTLQPALVKLNKLGPSIWTRALIDQARRNQVLGY